MYKIDLSIDFNFENINNCDYAEIVSTLEENLKHGTLQTGDTISNLKINKLEKIIKNCGTCKHVNLRGSIDSKCDETCYNRSL